MVKNNLGKICVSFPEDGKSVILKPSNDVYTLDKIYHPLALQVIFFYEIIIELLVFKFKSIFILF